MKLKDNKLSCGGCHLRPDEALNAYLTNGSGSLEVDWKTEYTPVIGISSKSSLLLEDETTEEAFSRLVNSDCSAYHDKLKRMLEAQSNSKKINQARHAKGKEEKVNKEDDDPQLMGEAKTAVV